MRAFWKLPKKATKQRLYTLQNRHLRSKIKNAYKHAKNVSTTHCSCSMKKTAPKKNLIFKKLEPFENCQKWPPSKGYRLCKIVTLCQKLKMHKDMLKRFLQHVAVVLCKNGSKKQLILQKWEHFENCQKWPPSKAYRPCKIVALGQKLKMHKNMLNTFLQHIAVVVCKKWLQKTANIQTWEHF